MIRAGEGIVLDVPPANWDERRYPNPDQLDLLREDNAHVGFGYASWSRKAAETGDIQINTSDRSHSGFSYDAGLFLDFTALPLLNIGVHAAYNRLAQKENDPDSKLQWMTIGVNAALVF